MFPGIDAHVLDANTPPEASRAGRRRPDRLRPLAPGAARAAAEAPRRRLGARNGRTPAESPASRHGRTTVPLRATPSRCACFGARSSRSSAGSAGRSASRSAAITRDACPRIGWRRALDPPAGGWAAGEPPMRPGNAVEVLIDGAQALPAIAAELRQAHSHVHLTGWHFSPDFALDARPRATRSAQPARRACRAPRRARAGRGQVRRCRSSVHRGATCARCAPVDRAHEDPVRARPEGTAAALPSRKDDRDRRSRRLRRRDRSHLGSPVTATTRTSIRRARTSAGTTPPPASKGRRWPMSPSTSACAGTR